MRDLLILLVRGQRIDRRYLYLLLALIVAAPFVFNIPVPPAVVLPETQSFFDTVEQMANDPVEKNKLVILCTNYGAGTLAENQTQTEAVMRHLMKRRLKFAIFGFASPQGRELAQRVADSIQERYDYVYGRDYVNIGYRPGDAVVPLLKAAVRDVPGSFGSDIRGTPLAQVPVMQGIRTVNDVGMIIEVTPSSTIGAWIQFYQRTGEKPIPTLFCPTAVMAPEAFPYLKSGQLQGMLNGLSGAIEYEVLTKEKGFGTRASASLSYAHLLIIVLIVLGNAGMFAERHLRRMRETEGRDVFSFLTNPDVIKVIVIWIGALCTLGIYTILYRENKVFRFFEHLFIGLATGYTIYITWNDNLKTRWWEPMVSGGQWWLAFALSAGMLFYMIYSKKNAWMSRLIFGLFFGAAAGQTFQGLAADLFPLVRSAVNVPLVNPPEARVPDAYWLSPVSAVLNNVLFIVILVSVMTYFFFSFEQKNRAVQGVSRFGRYILMFAFGSIFGSTIMARLSLLIGRLYFLIHDWIQVTLLRQAG